ncbi:hypothetical protein GALMADRAFT_135978 [Galerina marginata CBS 339.88]|uniref:Uncharacterized protein n=1 Tax=Galerina marginata (strain CBS 339.88) TaxID=685588 RepID=A0A067TCF3_GALM3|nr:hypothetical protein GALMADRAFT_135978 [Galerina marginata CBS 339.88]
MMLVQLPAIEAVSVPSLSSLPSLPSLPSFSLLTKPSTWLVLLATLVILSSIRAALLFVRPPSWTAGRKSVSFVTIVKEEKPTPVGASTSASATESQDGKDTSPGRTKPTEKKTSSWLWGLVKWDSLPALPERGRWQAPPPQMQQVQPGRRQGPAFEHPLPALYNTEVPVSMAKMIMSRHTFRRPASRPPPVRNPNAPQYQRKLPSMV